MIIHQIKDYLVENTTHIYQQMLDQEMSEERVIELLAFYLEMHIKDNFQSEDLDEKWQVF